LPPHLSPSGPIITVHLPNKSTITTLGSVDLPIPNSSVVIKLHICHPSHLSHNLSSLSQLCVQGCSATFQSNSVQVHDSHGTLILSGRKQIRDLLWDLPLPVHLPQSSSSSHFAINNVHDAEYVKFVHASFGSPALSTFHRAVRKGYLRSFPRITARMIRCNPPNPVATAIGHLDRTRHGMQSTQPSSPTPPPPSTPFAPEKLSTFDESQTDESLQDAQSDDDADHVFTKLIKVDEASHSDLTGAFPRTSRRGFLYCLISVWRGYIHIELLKSKSSADLVTAYSASLKFFHDKGGIRITLQRLDNETSAELNQFLLHTVDSIQFVPPASHRGNKAERAIRTFKNHFISLLSTADPTFPLNLWDEFIPQCEITLNLLHPFALDPAVSAYEGLHRATFDFSNHPIAPCGTRVLCFESPDIRRTWSPHGVKGFYLGPSLHHHRVFRIWIPTTSRVRESDTVAWFPQQFLMPGSSPTELVEAALRDLQDAVLKLSGTVSVPLDQRQLLLETTVTATDALKAVIGAYSKLSLPVVAPQDVVEQRVIPTLLTAPEQRVALPPTLLIPQPSFADLSSPVVAPIQHIPQQSSHPMTLRSSVTNAIHRIPLPQLKRSRKKIHRPSDLSRIQKAIEGPNIMIIPPSSPTIGSHQFGPHYSKTLSPEAIMSQALSYSTAPIISQLSKPTLSSSFTSEDMHHNLLATISQSIRQHSSCAADLSKYSAAVLNCDSIGNPLNYSSAMAGPDIEHWRQAEYEELVRLYSTSKTIVPILHSQLPSDRAKDVTYYSPQTKEKMKNGIKTFRIRGTAGGNLINYPGEVSARTAELTVVKCHLNATVSENAHYATVDIKDFYLGTPLKRPEFIRIPLKFLPQRFLDEYELHSFIQKRSILFRIDKGMYGLPQAGLLAQRQLEELLAKHGYVQNKFVPCLYTHITRNISFTLVVDDFGIKYHDRADVDHLIAALHELYKTTVDWTGSKYLGISLRFDSNKRTVALSIPDYIHKALLRFAPQLTHGAASPMIYSPPVYGNHITPDIPPARSLTPEEILLVQQIVGVFLFYARCVDPTFLPAVNDIASDMKLPTTALLDKCNRLLAYAASYPNNETVYTASDMILHIQSDASYLSRSFARSVAGGCFYIGNIDQPTNINGTVNAISNTIDVVVASAFEAEYAAVFIIAQIAVWLRTILHALGYPQPPTIILCDNECAVGIANDATKLRKGKAIDMRFHWIRDRISQKQFKVLWRKGANNLADFFTKALPVHTHQSLMPFLVNTPLDPNNPYHSKRVQRSIAWRPSRVD